MSLNDQTKTLLSLKDEYKAIGIAEQIDYYKFYLCWNIRKAIDTYKKAQNVDLIKPASGLINKSFDLITERLYGGLRKAGVIVRVGGNKTEYWEVVSLEKRKEGKV